MHRETATGEIPKIFKALIFPLFAEIKSCKFGPGLGLLLLENFEGEAAAHGPACTRDEEFDSPVCAGPGARKMKSDSPDCGG